MIRATVIAELWNVHLHKDLRMLDPPVGKHPLGQVLERFPALDSELTRSNKFSTEIYTDL